MAAKTVYDDVAEFIAGMDPKKVIEFKANKDNQKQLDDLLEKNARIGLNEKEKSDLDQYLMLNRIIGLAKARALCILAL